MNKKTRLKNKSNGPWGMKEFDITYSKNGDGVERQRFISAPDQESAVNQFNFIMKKAEIEAEIISIIEIKD